MAFQFPRNPRFFKLVERPDNVGDSELSRAQPIYISGLTVDASALTALTTRIEDLEARVEALENV